MQPISRRRFLQLAGLFSVAGSLPLLNACQQRFSQQPNAKVKIGYLPIVDATPLLVAMDRGLFEQRGLLVEKPVLFRSWAQLVEAFISGQVNVVHLLSPMTIWMRYGSTAPVKVVMWNHMAGSALTVLPTINSIADLGGQTIAIPFWYSIHNVVLQHMLRYYRLDVTERTPSHSKQVRLVVMSPSDMVAALAVKTIAGFIVAEPFSAMAEVKGVGKVLRFSADVWRDHACCVTLMHEHDIRQRPEWAENVVDALVEAQLWINDHRLETAQLLSKQGKHKFTPHEPQVLERVLLPDPAQWKSYIDQGVIRHPQWQQYRIDFQPYPYSSYTETLVSMLKQTHIAGVNTFLKDLAPAFVANDLVERRFVDTALKRQNAFERFRLPTSLQREETIIV